tara:strand:+ start:629 stop:994 length:366 start_codon:yes stop_codon:yes gene_type:complete
MIYTEVLLISGGYMLPELIDIILVGIEDQLHRLARLPESNEANVLRRIYIDIPNTIDSIRLGNENIVNIEGLMAVEALIRADIDSVIEYNEENINNVSTPVNMAEENHVYMLGENVPGSSS